MKKLRDLEREKDSLWIGLQVLEQARFWYQHQLDHVSQRHARIGTRKHDEKDVSPYVYVLCYPSVCDYKA